MTEEERHHLKFAIGKKIMALQGEHFDQHDKIEFIERDWRGSKAGGDCAMTAVATLHEASGAAFWCVYEAVLVDDEPVVSMIVLTEKAAELVVGAIQREAAA